jgi:hypothetical protein
MLQLPGTVQSNNRTIGRLASVGTQGLLRPSRKARGVVLAEKLPLALAIARLFFNKS